MLTYSELITDVEAWASELRANGVRRGDRIGIRMTSAFAVGMVVGAPVMAAFARRWPPRLTLIVCLLVFAGSHVI